MGVFCVYCTGETGVCDWFIPVTFSTCAVGKSATGIKGWDSLRLWLCRLID